MKSFIKAQLERFGVRLNFIRNLWYLDSFHLLNKLCANQNPVIFDVGACDGSSVQDFKGIFPKATIYSFEPFPDSFDNLVRISKIYKDVYPFMLALSDHAGEETFYVNKSKATNSLLKPALTCSFIDDHAVPLNTIKVETKQLDNITEELNISFIDILKIDVQGGELKVFEGAKVLLGNKKVALIYIEIWFIEGYEGQPLYSDIAGFLKQYDYFPFGIYNMHYRKDGHFLWGDAIFYLK